MATVDLAEDTLLGRRVALKRVTPAAEVSGLSRLRREAILGAALSHPNLVSVYDILTPADGDLIIVMEYVAGETLRDVLTRRGALPPSEALPLLAGVAAGLDAIHAAGIVHRDVKPSNILIGADGVVKLADLGIASVPDRTRITTSGSLIGSLGYMAPEQLEDAAATRAIDVYALAAMAFEVLSGTKARQESNPVALAHAIATKPPPSLRDAWPAAPRAVSDLLSRGMARDPAARPASAGELVADLRAGLAASSARSARPARIEGPERSERSRNAVVAPMSVPAAGRRRYVPPRYVPPRDPPVPVPGGGGARSRRWTLAAAMLGVVALAVVVLVLVNSGGSPSRKSAGSRARVAAPAHKQSTARRHGARTRRSRPAGTTGTTGAAGRASGAAGASTAQSTQPPPAAVGTTPTSSSSPPSSASGAVSSATAPVSAVESFYRLAASRHYSQAWALADPALRAQLRGYESFVAGQANDRSITFGSANTVSQTTTSSTVAVKTTSVQADGTHHCAGTVDLGAATAGHWELHQLHITCT